MHSVLIADDHPLFRRGVREVLEESGCFHVVAEAGDGVTALGAIRAHQPEVVVLDIAMPDLDGMEVLRQAQGWPAAPRFVVLSMFGSYAEAAFKAGAAGYVLKENAVDEIVQCLTRVVAGRRYVGQGAGLELRDGAPRPVDPLSALSPSERRVVKLVGEVKTSKEIAEILCVSVRTVQNHRARACAKLGLEGPQALLRFAIDKAEQTRG